MNCNETLNGQVDATISVKPFLATGINRAVYPILQYLNVDEIIFACEKLIIVQNVHTAEYRILQPLVVIQSRFECDISATYVASIAVCLKQQYFGVHLTVLNTQEAYVIIYKAQSKKKNHEKLSYKGKTRQMVQNVFSYESSERHANIDFSSDGQLICCASNKTLNVYDWKAGRRIAYFPMRYDVKRLLFNPFDMAQILSQSHDSQKVQLWVLEAYQLRLKATFTSAREQVTVSRKSIESGICEYLDYLWLTDDALVTLLTSGIVQLIVQDKVKQELNLGAISLGLSAQVPPESKFFCLALYDDLEKIAITADQGLLILKHVKPVGGVQELQVLRYLHVQTANALQYIAAMPKSALVVCFTSSHYGVCDLSAVFQFGIDKRSITFNRLCPSILTQLGSISIAIRQPYLAFVCESGKNDYFLSIWSMEHNGRIIVNHALDSKTASQLMAPRGKYLDIHPSGLEVLVGVNCRIYIYLIVNDALRLNYEATIIDSEVGSSYISQVVYNTSGSLFLCALTLHLEPCGIYVYRNYQRNKQTPQIITIIDTSKARISQCMWHPNDTSFLFIGDNGAKLSSVHIALDSESLILISHEVGWSKTCSKSLPSIVTVDTSDESNEFSAVTLSAADQFSREPGLEQPFYVLFVLEKLIISNSSMTRQSIKSIRQTRIRAWIYTDLYNEVAFDFSSDQLTAQQGKHSRPLGSLDAGELGLLLPYNLTALDSGSHQLLYAGTSRGEILILQWYLMRTGQPICNNVFQRASMRVTLSHRIDLHTVPITSLIFAVSTGGSQLITSTASGVIVICNIRVNGGSKEINGKTDVKESNHKNLSFKALQDVVDVGLYERRLIEKERFTYEELEVHLHQFRSESERLQAELVDQKSSFQLTLDQEKRTEEEKAALQEDLWRVKLRDAAEEAKAENDALIQNLSVKAKNDRIQYRSSIIEYQNEILLCRSELQKAQSQRQEEERTAATRMEQLNKNFEEQLYLENTKFESEKMKLTKELANAHQSLEEALEQVDEDHLRHLFQLSGSIETNKKEAQQSLTTVQGQVAGLNQELKLLLQALAQKDEEISQVQSKTSVYQEKIKRLKVSLKQQEEEIMRLRRSNVSLEAIANEQREALNQLKRLNTVHQSQALLLKSQLIPKENETQVVKQHMTQLHAAHQEMSLLAQFNDNLCFVQKAKIKKYENDSRITQRRIDRLQTFGRTILEELEQLLIQPVTRGSNLTRSKGSSFQVGREKSLIEHTAIEKMPTKDSTLRHNLQLLYRRWAKRWENLTASSIQHENETGKHQSQQKSEMEGIVEDASIQSEIERQNESLLRNKMQLHHQLELIRKEKSQLSATLTFQNTTLMTDLNEAKKKCKTLKQKLEEYHSRERSLSRNMKLIKKDDYQKRSSLSVTPMSPGSEQTEGGGSEERRLECSSSNAARMIRKLHHSASMPSKLEYAPGSDNQGSKSRVVSVVSPDFDSRTIMKAAKIKEAAIKVPDGDNWQSNHISNSQRVPLANSLKASGRASIRPVTATPSSFPCKTTRPQSAMDRK